MLQCGRSISHHATARDGRNVRSIAERRAVQASVIPAKAGIQLSFVSTTDAQKLDSGLRRNDGRA
jgi:hypothetical protein